MPPLLGKSTYPGCSVFQSHFSRPYLGYSQPQVARRGRLTETEPLRGLALIHHQMGHYPLRRGTSLNQTGSSLIVNNVLCVVGWPIALVPHPLDRSY